MCFVSSGVVLWNCVSVRCRNWLVVWLSYGLLELWGVGIDWYCCCLMEFGIGGVVGFGIVELLAVVSCEVG